MTAINGTNRTDVRTAAARYLQLGFVPIPVPRTRNSKAPELSGWQHLQPTEDDLATLFPPDRSLNVGLLLGKPSGGLVDVDLDCKEAVRAAPIFLPETGWVSGRASNPRSHWWFILEDPPDQATQKYQGPGRGESCLVELRSSGAQTIAPPGIHESGEEIVWHEHTEPARVDLDVLDRAVRRIAAVALLARSWPDQGSRQDATLALCGGLLRAGWSQHEVEQFVGALAVVTQDDELSKRARCVSQTAKKIKAGKQTTGWPRLGELLRSSAQEIVTRLTTWLQLPPGSCNGKGQQPAQPTKSRALVPYRPFPLSTLPSPLREYIAEGSRALRCDPAYLGMPALAATASLVGNSRTIALKRSWEEPCVVWSLIVGDSGTLKSPAYLKIVSPLFQTQKRLLKQHNSDMEEFQEAKARHEQTLKESRKKNYEGDPPGEPPQEPVLHRVICSDTTIEKLAEILEDNPRGTLLARDELAGWLGSFSRYRGKQGGSDLPNWLELFRAGTLIVDRKTAERKTIFVTRAAVSITGGIQPGALARAFTDEFLDAGLAARLLMAMPPKRPKCWTEAEIDPRTEGDFESLLEKLGQLEMAECQDELYPVRLELSREAKKLWIQFYNEWGQQQIQAEGEIASALSKLEGYAARLALLHHVVTCVGQGISDEREIGPDSVKAGIELCHWLASESRRIYSVLSESTEERESRRLLEHIQSRGGTITIRELMRANCRRYPDTATAREALNGLVENGLGHWSQLPPKKRGKPVLVFHLCMTHDTHDTVGESEEDLSEADSRTLYDTLATGTSVSGTACTTPIYIKPTTEASYDESISSGTHDSVMRVMRHAHEESKLRNCEDQLNEKAGSGSVSSKSVMHIQMSSQLDRVLECLISETQVALDLETTGLDPRQDRIRLISLAIQTEPGIEIFLIDCFQVDPSPVLEILTEKELIIHNGAFDVGFLMQGNWEPKGRFHDTMLMARLLTAGTDESVKLADCCQRYLGISLDKEEQTSDWSADLSKEQIDYAARDAAILIPLHQRLQCEIENANLTKTLELEERCLPSLVWMSNSGVPFHPQHWRDLAQSANEVVAEIQQQLNEEAPEKPTESSMAETWNWNSPQQVKEALKLAGCEVANTSMETLSAIDHPLAQLLVQYRHALKQSTTFGEDWLKHVAENNRVYPSWWQLGAASGRMSCSAPNMQQIPQGQHRECICAPAGRVLIKADYSQIELRIAAKISADEALLHAYLQGEDLHSRTARNVLGVDKVSKENRQLAKALNFGLLYGMGTKGFQRYAQSSYGISLTAEEAKQYRDNFFQSYPGLARWHRTVRKRKARETRTLADRRRLLEAKCYDTKRLNSPVQGTGADGLKLALALLWERREEIPGAFPVLAVHDEIVLECEEDQAERVSEWLKDIMIEAMTPLIAPVPVEVDVQICSPWGGE